jgi:hypothetical protein
MDAGVFELKIQLLLVGKQCQFQCGMKVWLKVCSQTFIPPWNFDWKFAVKLSYPPESLHWKFQWKFQGPLKVSLKLSLQNFKGVWKFDWNFQCKLSRGYESLTANFQPNFQGGMKVWLQTFNQSFKVYASLTAKFQSKFQGVCKFDCKCSTKLSMQSKKTSNMFKYVGCFCLKPKQSTKICTSFPHNNDQMFYFLVEIK